MDDLRFDGRVALITGAGRGMGRAHALLLAARGAKVVVNDFGGSMTGNDASAGPAQEVVEEIRAAGGTALANMSDVSTEAGANAMVQAAIDTFGRIDIVVHNAGIVTFIPFADMSYEQYRKLVSVHQDGAFLVCKAAWPHMVRQSYGRLILITSGAVVPGLAHYASAKAAITGFVKPLAFEGQAHGIRANALSVIAFTRLMQSFFRPEDGHGGDIGLFGQDKVEAWWRDNLRPEQVSPVVAWLAHEQCDISGETLSTGGGAVNLRVLADTHGYAHVDLTPELVKDHRAEILNIENVEVQGAPGSRNEFDRVVAAGAPPLPAPKT